MDNSDIIQKMPSLLEDTRAQYKWQNVQLKANLKEGEDYMIVDENIFNYWSKRYTCDNPVQRIGILVNEDTEEAIVEIYLKPI